MFRSTCDKCHEGRLDVARTTFEEASIKAHLGTAMRLRDRQLLETLYVQLESVRARRLTVQLAYRQHRMLHTHSGQDL